MGLKHLVDNLTTKPMCNLKNWKKKKEKRDSTRTKQNANGTFKMWSHWQDGTGIWVCFKPTLFKSSRGPKWWWHHTGWREESGLNSQARSNLGFLLLYPSLRNSHRHWWDCSMKTFLRAVHEDQNLLYGHHTWKHYPQFFSPDVEHLESTSKGKQHS